jgi:hypothetical protein
MAQEAQGPPLERELAEGPPAAKRRPGQDYLWHRDRRAMLAGHHPNIGHGNFFQPALNGDGLRVKAPHSRSRFGGCPHASPCPAQAAGV